MRTTGFRLAAAFAAIIVAGCWRSPAANQRSGETDATSTSVPLPPAARSAHDVLAKLSRAYSEANSYRDRGVMVLAYHAAGERVRDEQPLSLAWQRPQRLRLQAYQLLAQCDGQQFLAQIADPSTNNIDGQYVLRTAPTQWSLGELSADALLHETLLGRVRRPPLPLELLWQSPAFVEAADKPGVSKLLKPAMWDDTPCQRVEVTFAEGPLTLWVGEPDGLLRRVDFPAAKIFPELAADATIRNLELFADVREPTVNDELAAESFAVHPPADGKRMKSFVIPPKPLPTELLGKRPKAFSLTKLDGSELKSADLSGKIQVLLWFAHHPASQAAVQQFELVREALQEADGVQFHAVCTEPETVPNVKLKQLLSEWQTPVSAARDLEAAGRDVFQIDEVPALVVLDAEGKVETLEPRVGDDLAHRLPLLLKRLLQGESVAKESLAAAAAERKRYEELVAQGGPEPGQVIELPQTTLLPASPPERVKLAPRWQQRELDQPGNLLVVRGEKPRLFVSHAKGKEIAELGATGQVIARYKLDLPENSAVTFLRTATGKDGQRFFAGGAPLGPQAYLFDDHFKTVVTYPPPTQKHAGIRDAQVFDLDQDGEVELYVGFWSLHGLHGVAADGRSLFRQRQQPTVLSIVSVPPADFPGRLLVTSPAGAILPLNRFGNDEPEIKVRTHPIVQLAAAEYADAKQAAYAALSHGSDGRLVVLGLPHDFHSPSWTLNLPQGVHERPIEFLASGPLPQGNGWLIAGADGSLQLIGDDGEFRDRWQTGVALGGIALLREGDDVVAIQSSDAGVEAFTLTAGK